MSYIGSTPVTQSFIAGTDYFNGNGSTTAFTLSRNVVSTNDIQATVNNVVQQPNDAYTVSGTTITFTSAPSAGTSNIYVRYLSTTTQSITPSQGTVGNNQFANNISAIPMTYGTIGAGNASIMKNRIINGAMVIDQRNAGASVTVTDSAPYTIDRWWGYSAPTAKFTVQRNAGSVTPPAGFKNYLGATSSSAYSVTAADQFFISQNIEGFNIADLEWGTANAKTVTLSFQVRSSLTGTFAGSIQNGTNARSYVFSYSIPVANTWTPITITITGDTTGTWNSTNGVGLLVLLSVGAGTNYNATAGAWSAGNFKSVSGATSVVGTNGATFYITGVQLEVGSSATGFEYRQYGQELALCQRYFEKTYNIDVAPTTNTSAGIYDLSGSSDSLGNLIIRVNFAVSKRANPTVTLYTSSGSSGIWNYNRNGASGTGAGTVDNIGMSGVRVYIATGANWVVGGVGGHWIASAEL